MKKTYEVADRTDKRAITEFLKREGQFLLPMVELVERTEMAVTSRQHDPPVLTSLTHPPRGAG